MPSADIIVLDTHALLWWQSGGQRLSTAARAHIDQATKIAVCPISFWEIAMLAEKGRIVLDRPAVQWTNDLLTDSRLEATDLTPSIAASAGALPDFHGDPADRLIYTTARSIGAPLLTKDAQFHRHADHHDRMVTVW
jgi:PIN domain nuclease of toxin-antitoxin system